MIRWIYAFVDRPISTFEWSAAFWTAVTGTGLSPRRGQDRQFATLLPPQGDPCLKLQGVHDDGGAHLDLCVADPPAADLGAVIVEAHHGWSTMRSPGGQRFCLVPWHGEATRPEVVTGPDRASTRLDQVCIDLPPSLYDAEVAFWTAITGWECRSGSLPEFRLIKPPAAAPIQILLQRLETEQPTAAHLDLACSDPDTTRVLHEAAGAELVGRWPSWIVLRDPAGCVYRLTDRNPRTGA